MTSINHSNNLSFVTLHFSSSTPPPSSTASSSSTSSTGWTYKITKKIQELKSELESLKNLKEAKNGYLPEQHSKSLDSLPTQLSALETVHKLAEFADRLDTNKNASNNILNNLCTGLEKFLGFNKDSKGYTGQGIVYSDLDRLCDGVMGFLYGVLSAVKDDDAVKTYDEYMNESDRLEKVLKELNNKIGSGRAGLAVSVGAVREWLEGYVKEVNRKNHKVKTSMNKISTEIGSLITKIEPMKNSEYNVYSQGVVKEWLADVKELPTYCSITALNVRRLDYNVEKQLITTVGMVSQAVQTFVENAKRGHEGLLKVCEKVDNDLSALERQVHETTQQAVAKLNISVTEGIQLLQQQVTECLSSKVKTLQETVAKLENIRLIVERAVNNVNEKFENDSITLGTNTVPGMARKAAMIHSAADSLERDDHLGGLWQQIAGVLEKQTNEIVDEEGDGLLGGVVTNFGIYVQSFPDKFKSDLVNMIDEILKSGGIQKLLIEHVTWNRDYLHGTKVTVDGTSAMVTNLTRIVKEQLTAELETIAAKPLMLGTQNNVEKNISEIVQYLTQFVREVKRKENQLLQKIGDHIKNVSTSRSYSNYYLENALKIIIAAVNVAAEGSGRVLTKFNQDSPFKQLPAAIENVRTLSNKLKEGVKTQHIDTILTSVNENVTRPADDIRKKLTNIIDEVNEQITALKNSVAEDENAAEDDAKSDKPSTLKGLEKTLVGKIDDLNQQVTSTLDAQVSTLKENTLEKATNLCQSTITSKGTTESATARKQIKQEALRKFAETKSAELNDLKQLVAKELETLKSIIKQDSETGIKGLMKAMYGGEYAIQSRVDSTNLLVKLQQATNRSRKPENYEATKYAEVAKTADDYLGYVLFHVSKEIMRLFNVTGKNRDNVYYNRVTTTFGSLDKLLKHLTGNDNRTFTYDFDFSCLLSEFDTHLVQLNPSNFGEIPMPCLEVVRKPLQAFVSHLGKSYVNSYSGAARVNWGSVKSMDGERCAKALLTIFETLFNDLHELFYYCTTQWRKYTINGSELHETSDLKDFMLKCGYNFEHLDRKKTGTKVAGRLYQGFHTHGEFKNAPQSKHDIHAYLRSVSNVNDSDTVLLGLVNHLQRYYRVWHLYNPASPKYPCTVFDMLAWLYGIKYNAYYGMLVEQCKTLADSAKYNALTYMASDLYGVHLPTMFAPIYDVLVGIVGHGDATTYYGCDYSSNRMGLYYPSNASVCFDTLLDILRRLHPVLTFLLDQCQRGESHFGWGACKFGKDVQPNGWQCDPHGDMLPSSTHDCSGSSPLHLYLTDSLRGMLPHDVASHKSKLVCSTCSKNGTKMPCLTPLGFRGFSQSKRTGKHLCKVLDKLCGAEGILTKVYSTVSCLTSRAPQTLPDVFAFYCQLTQSWTWMPDNENGKKVDPIQQEITNKIRETVACRYDDAKNLLRPCRYLYEYSDHSSHNFETHADLKCLLGCGNYSCGNYIQPLNSTAYKTLVTNHAAKYMSWLLYVADDIFNFLSQLTKALSSISCHEHGCHECDHSGKCVTGKHGKDECGCESIVHCRGVMPTLYRFGLTYGDVKKLMNGDINKCRDFAVTLEKAQTSDLMVNWLKAIDTFMWTIRTPFSYLVLALWSASFLYLLCVMVGRLDVLHIRSHLRSPSSHKITAQSLLAAAQVGRLAKISYLQP